MKNIQSIQNIVRIPVEKSWMCVGVGRGQMEYPHPHSYNKKCKKTEVFSARSPLAIMCRVVDDIFLLIKSYLLSNIVIHMRRL